MKKSLLLVAFLLHFTFAFAQNQLLVQRNEKGLFLNHKVMAKENYYSIGRLYNVTPKEIEALNNLDMTNDQDPPAQFQLFTNWRQGQGNILYCRPERRPVPSQPK